MKYMLLLRHAPDAGPVEGTPEFDAEMAKWGELMSELGGAGALVAALLPVALAVTAFVAANGLLALASYQLHIFDTTASVMLLMGLAVGVDYCLFYLRRERDERAAGRDAETALQVAAATSGRAVLISGLTVMVAMSGMFLSGLLMFKGFAVATMHRHQQVGLLGFGGQTGGGSTTLHIHHHQRNFKHGGQPQRFGL